MKYLALLLFVIVLIGCKKEKANSEKSENMETNKQVSLPPKDPSPQYKKENVFHSITWENWDGTSKNPEAVVYFFDGKSMGKGKAGFENVLECIKKLDNGSNIRLPTIIKQLSIHDGGKPFATRKEYPFQNIDKMDDKFRKIIREKEIYLRAAFAIDIGGKEILDTEDKESK